MDTGYADVNGLHMCYEIHGDEGTPLVLLHGGVMTVDLTYAALIPPLATRHRLIGVEFQAHGATADIDRDLTYADLASDVVGLLDHLGIDRRARRGDAGADPRLPAGDPARHHPHAGAAAGRSAAADARRVPRLNHP